MIKKSSILFVFALLLAGSTAIGQGQSPITKLILRDEGLSQLSYVDLTDPSAGWMISIPQGRDLQLVGRGRVLVGTVSGYEELEIATGKKVAEVTNFLGTLSAHRLRNGRTLLAGVNMIDRKGLVLVEVDEHGKTYNVIHYPEKDYVRLVRETVSNTLVITSDTTVWEADKTGKVLWKVSIKSLKRPHTWQANRLANGETLIAAGYAGNFQVFSPQGKLVRTFNGPPEIKPNFYAGFQILNDGNIVVTNWQGHGPGHGDAGVQLLEYSPDGKLIWQWKQDPAKYSSLQQVLVLDGLDLEFLHVEDADGKLAPVK